MNPPWEGNGLGAPPSNHLGEVAHFAGWRELLCPACLP